MPQNGFFAFLQVYLFYRSGGTLGVKDKRACKLTGKAVTHMNMGWRLNTWFCLLFKFSKLVCFMKISFIFLLVYEFGPGVRIFKKFAGVRIRILVYEKELWCTNLFLVCEFSKKLLVCEFVH